MKIIPMRTTWAVWLLAVVFPAAAHAQGPSFSVQAAAGPTIVETGYTVSVAGGFSPWSRVTFLLDVQRTQQNSRITRSERDGVYSVSTFRGGTMTAVSGEVRVGLFPASRWTPYVLTGFGRGISHPTVNADFPNAVENETRFVFFGAGVHVPVREHLSFFGDIRLLVGAEGTHADGMMAMCPIRLGIAWRF